jgi:hypothetical protein
LKIISKCTKKATSIHQASERINHLECKLSDKISRSDGKFLHLHRIRQHRRIRRE